MSTGTVSWAALPAARHTPVPGDCWARLGDTIVVWSKAGEPLRSGGRLLPTARAAGLALVTQVGRAFQDEHPGVRVLVDHGRHLVVDTATAGAAGACTTCWRIEPLPAAAIVVARPALGAGRADPGVAALVGLLDPSACEADLRTLVGFGTRHSLSAGFTAAAAWAAARLAGLGCAVQTKPVSVGAGTSANVVADRPAPGTGHRNLVLVTAHLDSVNTAGGAAAPAPGADDNGSGCAGLLELARVLGTRTWTHDLRLILFGGEEQGLHGSTQYVAGLPAGDRARLSAVLNMDMVATRNTVAPAVLLEGAPVAQGLIDDLAAAAATWTGLRVETSLSPFASDHVPFIDAGLPAVLTIEGADRANGNVHTDRDTMAHIDLGLMIEILRMDAAVLAGRLGAVPAVPRPSGPVVARAPGLLDMSAIAPDGTLVHKAWDGQAWQPGVTGYTELGRPARA